MPTAKGYLLANGQGSSGQVLISQGPGVLPVWSSTLTGAASCGSFYDTAQQPLVSATASQLVTINTSDLVGAGITLVAGSKVTVSGAGIYNLQFSAQLQNADNASIRNATVWIRKNFVTGTGNDSQFDIPYSAGQVSVPNKHGNVNGHLIAAWNLFLSLAANDYVQFWWSGESTDLSLETSPAGTTPTTPASAAMIVTMTQVR